MAFKPSCMKNIFLLLAIASFSLASAQQNDLFDIQKHLKKRTELRNKQRAEKLFSLPNTRIRQPFQYPLLNNNVQVFHSMPESKLLAQLKNGNKLYLLPQDNMPCVVPDMSEFNMLVLKPDVQFTIPNAAIPPTNNPPNISADIFKKLLDKQKSPR